MKNSSQGTLYLCATPIGNLEDITYRVVRILGEADLIAAEDTRNSIKLLNHFNIKTPMTSYHEFNKIEKAVELIEKLKGGMNIALITDAGTPGISDPGEELVKMCYEQGIEVNALPGAVAAVCAVTSSGQACRRFAFEAFLPKDKKDRKRVLEEMSKETRTIVMYEAPHHLKGTLDELYKALGDRQLTLCRELTKLHEEKLQMTLSEAIEYYKTVDPKGEYVLCIAGKSRQEVEAEERSTWEAISIEDHYQKYIDDGMSSKDAMKAVAKDRGLSKRDIYAVVGVKEE